MKLYGAKRIQVIHCEYHCCGAELHKRPNYTNPNLKDRIAAKKRERFNAKKEIKVYKWDSEIY